MENQEAATTATAQAEQVTPETTNGSLIDFILSDGQSQVVKQQEQQAAATEQAQSNAEEKTFNHKEWLKQEFDVEDAAILKQEREELKAFREKTKQEEFKNEDSKKVYEYLREGKEDEVYEYFSKKKQIEKLSKADVTADKNVAAELVKFGIKNENKEANLSEEEINFLFNQRYSVPKEPNEDDYTDVDAFEKAMLSWKEQVQTIEKRIMIEAKMQQPKLSQLNQEIVLPDIKRDQQNALSQEDLDALKQMQESFVQTAKTSIDGFKGFDVNVKDKDVDYNVSYVPSAEEKTLVNEKLNEFAKSGFDANALLADRWVNEDGKTLNVERMVKDLSLIYSNEKLSQKLVTDAANKRLELYLKEKKNITLNETVTNGQFNPDNKKTQQEALTEAILAI
jgi:hypothetical protein